MSTHEHGVEAEAPTPAPAPTTGHRLVDAALAEFGSITDHAPQDHHAGISAVAEVLASVLESRHDGSATRPQPGMPGPR